MHTLTLTRTHTHTHTHTPLQGEIWSLFSINMSTGQISLDRPIMPVDIAMATYTFTVVAADSGPIPLTSSANVIVRVLNSTEHPFRFTTSYFYDETRENSRTFSAGTSSLRLDVTPAPDFFADYAENPFQFLFGTSVSIAACLVPLDWGSAYQVDIVLTVLTSECLHTCMHTFAYSSVALYAFLNTSTYQDTSMYVSLCSFWS